MSTTDESRNASTNTATGDDGNETQNQNQNTDPETVKDPASVLKKNRELLAEIARIKEQNRQLAAEKEQENLTRLEQEGNKDELISALKKQVKDSEDKTKSITKAFAGKTVRQQMLTAAAKAGAENPDLVLRLVDTSEIEISDDFEVNADQLNSALGKVKDDVPALFKKQTSAPRDGNPGGFETGKKDLSKMTDSELRRAFKRASAKK